MDGYITLDNMNAGERAVVYSVGHRDGMRKRLLDLGLIAGTDIECVGQSPAGDPKAFLIRGAVIALRSEDSCLVTAERL